MKKNILIFISGMLSTLVIGVGAATLLTANDVSYSREGSTVQTAKEAIDELNNNAVTGKSNIITALSGKGFSVNSNASYTDIVSSINKLGVTLSEKEDGTYGYKIDGEDSVNNFSGGGATVSGSSLLKHNSASNTTTAAVSASTSTSFASSGYALILGTSIIPEYKSSGSISVSGGTETASFTTDLSTGNTTSLVRKMYNFRKVSAGNTVSATTTIAASGGSIHKIVTSSIISLNLSKEITSAYMLANYTTGYATTAGMSASASSKVSEDGYVIVISYGLLPDYSLSTSNITVSTTGGTSISSGLIGGGSKVPAIKYDIRKVNKGDSISSNIQTVGSGSSISKYASVDIIFVK